MNIFNEIHYTSNDHEEQPKLSSQKETKDESKQVARRYSGRYSIIALRTKVGEPLVLLVIRAQISVELQSRYLNEANENLRLLVKKEAWNEG